MTGFSGLCGTPLVYAYLGRLKQQKVENPNSGILAPEELASLRELMRRPCGTGLA